MLVGGDDVHVALDDDDALLRTDRLFRSVESVEQGALVEQGRLWRVDVLGAGCVRVGLLRRCQEAGAEARDLTTLVADGEHEPVAKAVVAAALALDQQPGGHQLIPGEVALCKVALQGVPAFEAVAELEHLDRVSVQSAGGQVGASGLRLLRVEEGVVEVGGGGLVRLEQPLLSLVLLGVPALAEADARPLSEQSQRLAELDVVPPHHEVKHVAAAAARAEAVPGLAVRCDRERGGLLVMKWTARLEVAPGALQRDGLADQLDNVDAALYFIDDAHARSPFTTVPCPLRLRVRRMLGQYV